MSARGPSTDSSQSGRSAARLAAVQALYQIDLTAGRVDSVIGEFTVHRLGATIDGDSYTKADLALFTDLVKGVTQRRTEIDLLLDEGLSDDWTPKRLEAILRAILRAGIYELLVRADVPARVVINEYLDVAHAFFDGSQPALVNGVLDTLARQLRGAELSPGTPKTVKAG